jgi:tRNA1Val (adenine37-N6)-methyltransferase
MAGVRFVAGDARDFDVGPFDHVVFNPPFHPASGQASPSSARDKAMRDTDDSLVAWTSRAIRQVREGGTVTLILHADRLDEWRASVEGAVSVKALLPREGEAPKRMIAWVQPGKRTAFKRLPPLILHEDDGRPTHAADAILRHGAALAMI